MHSGTRCESGTAAPQPCGASAAMNNQQRQLTMARPPSPRETVSNVHCASSSPVSTDPTVGVTTPPVANG